jgi:hypothetical protein
MRVAANKWRNQVADRASGIAVATARAIDSVWVAIDSTVV